jgi:hypothetical protein
MPAVGTFRLISALVPCEQERSPMDEVNPLAPQSGDPMVVGEKSERRPIQELDEKALQAEAHRIGVEAVARALDQAA